MRIRPAFIVALILVIGLYFWISIGDSIRHIGEYKQLLEKTEFDQTLPQERIISDKKKVSSRKLLNTIYRASKENELRFEDFCSEGDNSYQFLLYGQERNLLDWLEDFEKEGDYKVISYFEMKEHNEEFKLMIEAAVG